MVDAIPDILQQVHYWVMIAVVVLLGLIAAFGFSWFLYNKRAKCIKCGHSRREHFESCFSETPVPCTVKNVNAQCKCEAFMRPPSNTGDTGK